jgi:hypothetical protein
MENIEQFAADVKALKQAMGVNFSSTTQSGQAGAYTAAS